MAKLKIMDFQNIAYDTEFDLKEVENVIVTVITGDEILIICTKDERVHYMDAQDYSGMPRSEHYFDGSYVINSSELEKWNNRKTTYDYDVYDFD